MSWVHELARPDIVALKPYEHAAWDPRLERLHANELPWRGLADPSAAGLNRYPEPQPHALVERLAALYGAPVGQVLVGRGSDEAIDLLTRVFCRAGSDAVIVCPPTFGMYAVAARIQGAAVVTVPLLRESGYALDEAAVLAAAGPNVRLVYVCSPNNPTGNVIGADAVVRIARALAGRALVVVDEAYVEFSTAPSFVPRIADLPNVAVLRTLSKAHGLAGARCGTVIAHPEVIALLRKVIPPYAITQLTVESVLKLLEPASLAVMRERVAQVLAERARLAAELPKLAGVQRVWPSEANFLLVEFDDPLAAYRRIAAAGLIVRDARGYPGLAQALRITVGTPEQNARVLEALR